MAFSTTTWLSHGKLWVPSRRQPHPMLITSFIRLFNVRFTGRLVARLGPKALSNIPSIISYGRKQINKADRHGLFTKDIYKSIGKRVILESVLSQILCANQYLLRQEQDLKTRSSNIGIILENLFYRSTTTYRETTTIHITPQ